MTPLLRLPIDVVRLAARTGLQTTRWALRHVPGADRLPGLDDHRPAADTSGDVPPTAVRHEAPVRDTPPRSPLADAVPLPPHPGTGNGVGRARATPTPAPPPVAEPLRRSDRHIDVEVEEVASFGPADDVGGLFEVDEPWSGYALMGARDVVERLVVADAATKAAVALYEAQHKRRQTILAATRGS